MHNIALKYDILSPSPTRCRNRFYSTSHAVFQKWIVATIVSSGPCGTNQGKTWSEVLHCYYWPPGGYCKHKPMWSMLVKFQGHSHFGNPRIIEKVDVLDLFSHPHTWLTCWFGMMAGISYRSYILSYQPWKLIPTRSKSRRYYLYLYHRGSKLTESCKSEMQTSCPSFLLSWKTVCRF